MSWLDWLNVALKVVAVGWVIVFAWFLAAVAVVNHEVWRETHPKPTRNKTHGPTT